MASQPPPISVPRRDGEFNNLKSGPIIIQYGAGSAPYGRWTGIHNGGNTPYTKERTQRSGIVSYAGVSQDGRNNPGLDVVLTPQISARGSGMPIQVSESA